MAPISLNSFVQTQENKKDGQKFEGKGSKISLCFDTAQNYCVGFRFLAGGFRQPPLWPL